LENKEKLKINVGLFLWNKLPVLSHMLKINNKGLKVLVDL